MGRHLTGLYFLMVSFGGLNQLCFEKSIYCRNHILVFHISWSRLRCWHIIDYGNAASRGIFIFDRANAQIVKAFRIIFYLDEMQILLSKYEFHFDPLMILSKINTTINPFNWLYIISNPNSNLDFKRSVLNKSLKCENHDDG